MTGGSLLVDIAPDGSFSIDGVAADPDAVRRAAEGKAVFLRGTPDIQFAQVQAAMIELQGLNMPVALVGKDNK
ncbi:hypothetical protein MU852_16475 [Brevundimonas albigilva]|uniref:Biopolymer transporter ExbD n=1 Tax=Brevundimonas albigilva TaxID=1312364 RepID=A0ABY4SVC8_9CAUL|nr:MULTISPECIES: hypothetical protein [Brevundimonas]UQV18294.1 hypothetical protein MU852_16475 [Brevundimonas albigilva]URI16848.1 hypothetical protein M8231_07770 [Brevundimonas albigilva]